MGWIAKPRRTIVRTLRTRAPRVWHALAYWRYLQVGEPEIHRLDELVDPERIAVDVGVHLGFYSRRLAQLAKTVVGFEANPENAALLRRCLVGSVDVRAFALSSEPGSTCLRVPLDTRGAEALGTIASNNDLGGLPFREIAVPMARLDAFELPPVGFIKIDVEGHEEAVLEGARGVLERDHPTLMIEIEERHNPGATCRIPKTLGAIGYSAEVFAGRELIPLSAFDARRDQTPGGDRYLNNFLFRAG